MPDLIDRLEDIREAITAILTAANIGVNAIIFGDRTRVNELRPPVLWVIPDDSTIDTSGMAAMAEDWAYSFAVTAVVKNTDPKPGRLLANRIAAAGSQALVKSRNLNGTVSHIRRVRYLPGDARGMDAAQLHGAGYMMEARFRYLEREV